MLGLGNDAPAIAAVAAAPGEVDGIVGVAFTVAESSDDVVSDDVVKVRIEYDVEGDGTRRAGSTWCGGE